MITRKGADWYLKLGLIETAFYIYKHISIGTYCSSVSGHVVVEFIPSIRK